MNTSGRLSSSNSPATTNQTKTTNMDSSNQDMDFFEVAPTAAPANVHRSASQRTVTVGGTAPFHTSSHFLSHTNNLTSVNNPAHAQQRANKTNLLNFSAATSAATSHNVSAAHATSFHQHGPNLNRSHQLNSSKRVNNSSLIPANVSRLLQMSKEAGVKGAIQSLGLLCLVSLLFALLSLVFLLKLSPAAPVAPGKMEKKLYGYDFLSAAEYAAIYEVTLGMCALSLSLNLCCLLVCAIQFLLAVKLVKSSPTHGKTRYYTNICQTFHLDIYLIHSNPVDTDIPQ